MSRIKPTSNIDVIGKLDLAPENAFGTFLEARQQNAYFIKPPNCDSAGETHELFLIRSQWEHEAMRTLQTEMLTHMKFQASVNANRIMRLNKIQSNLRKRLIEVSSFIKDCDEKRITAEKKVNEEVEHQELLRQGIKAQQESIATLTEFRKQLNDTVQDFEPYESVIKDVVKQSTIFDSIKDCMDRCDALMLTQVEINTLEQEKIQEIEEMHKKMKKVINDAAFTVMGLQNDLAELERSYTRLNHTCQRWEKILENSKNAVAENDCDKASALDGIRVMYRLLCARRNINTVLQRHEVEAALDFIKEEIEILQEVYEISNRDTARSTEDKDDYAKGCI